jgi:hypothetical protein
MDKKVLECAYLVPTDHGQQDSHIPAGHFYRPATRREIRETGTQLRVLNDRRLTRAAVAVYERLLDRLTGSYVSELTLAFLQQDTGYKRRQIQYAIKQLESFGYITVIRGGGYARQGVGMPSIYILEAIPPDQDVVQRSALHKRSKPFRLNKQA